MTIQFNLKRKLWLDIELNLVFGDRWGHRDCHWAFDIGIGLEVLF